MYGGKKRNNDQHDSQGNHNAKEKGKYENLKAIAIKE